MKKSKKSKEVKYKQSKYSLGLKQQCRQKTQEFSDHFFLHFRSDSTDFESSCTFSEVRYVNFS